MALIQWRPDYALGIPSVDHEHREMIRMINDIYEQLDGGSESSAIEACLEEIYAGIASHFALEEKHMRAARYPEYGAHKDEHENLLDQLLEMMDIYAADPGRGETVLKNELSDWFRRHFATFDARLHHELDHHG